MRTTIIYFSQTGNTGKIAQAMAETFKEAGHTVRTLSLKKAMPEDVAGTDLLGMGTACFGSQAPTPGKSFLQKLPHLRKTRGFVFATANEAPGRVLYDQTRLLRSKGVDIIGGFLSRGENFYPAPSVCGRFPGRPDAKDLERARGFARAVAGHVRAGATGPVAGSRPDALKPMWGVHDVLRFFQTDAWLRMLSPKPKLVLKKCTQCAWCATECPVGNIALQPYPVLGRRCIRCYRCLTSCPQAAFSADLRLTSLLCKAVYNQPCARWFGDLEPGEKILERTDR